jgi:glutathione S-transferase
VTDYKLYGATMSPFSMKMRAYMRYRRIPFQWITDERANKVASTKVETYMVPVLEDPEGVFRNDSTFMIDLLEERFPDRRAEPEDEADAFLAYLIEDYADEWLLWPFFMLRWREDDDRRVNSRWIVYEYLSGMTTSPQFEAVAAGWSDRQVNLVGLLCGGEAAFPLLEKSLQEFLSIAERAFSTGMFLFGARPSRAEFALYGNLSQLILDHTPSPYLRDNFSHTYRWVTVMEDQSGREGAWNPLSADPERLKASPVADLLRQSAKYHLPLLRANREAFGAGKKMLAFQVDGETFSRRRAKRHLHCLPAIQERYQCLSDEAKANLDGVLTDTGCMDYLA